MSAYVPYCSSDIYTGTRAPSEQSEGLAFYGRHIVMAILADLLENTWLPQAEQLVLMGFSAGAFGTEANCDLVADTLHSVNPDIGVKCIIDSGSIYPLNTHRCLTCHMSQYPHYLPHPQRGVRPAGGVAGLDGGMAGAGGRVLHPAPPCRPHRLCQVTSARYKVPGC